MTNLHSVLKNRGITLPTKIHIVKAMVFPVVINGCESWILKKAEHRTDHFELWYWRRLLRVLGQCSDQSSQSYWKSMNILCKDWCLSWFADTLATWCEELTHWKRLWCWEKSRAGGEEGDKGWDSWMADSMNTWVKVAHVLLFVNPTDDTVHGILQARILEWVVFPFSRRSSQLRDWTQAPALRADSLPAEPPGKSKNTGVGSLSLLQRIFPTQEPIRGLLHCGWILYQLSYQGTWV